MISTHQKVVKLTLPTPFAVGDVNVYIIKGDALTLVDAGVKTKEAWEAFTYKLEQNGLTPRDIDQVVLTHHHPDHVGLLDWLPSNIPVYGHPYVRPWIEQDEEFLEYCNDFYRQLFVEFGVEGFPEKMLVKLQTIDQYQVSRQLTGEIHEGDILPGLEDWDVFETPGHAQGHLVFYRKKDRLLLSGDHILATISSNPLLEPSLHSTIRPQPQIQYNESLRKMLELDIDLALTGHGADVRKVHELVERRLWRQHERALGVRKLIIDRPLTTFELTRLLFPAVYEAQIGFTLSETTGQLDYLLSIGAVKKEVDSNGVAYFSAI